MDLTKKLILAFFSGLILTACSDGGDSLQSGPYAAE